MDVGQDAFLKHAKSMVDLVLDATGHDLVYRELCRREPSLRQVSFERFCDLYLPAKLALGCVNWVGCCEVHKITDKETQNLFFREVMNSFQSPRALDHATRFSESLYASNADTDNPPAVGVLAHLFSLLNLNTVAIGQGGERTVHSAFGFIMEVNEALKTVFENHFDEIFYADEEMNG
ncbi:MAG: hypothetical protein KTQ49_02935 [Candidatus Omnitrophica bacterium]|nr:hypothetical protein [Candidatus Omnitrophota bacterium]